MNLADILAWLDGKKTYITIFITALFNLGVGLSWWTPDNQIVIFVNTILGAFGFGFLRAGIAKSGRK